MEREQLRQEIENQMDELAGDIASDTYEQIVTLLAASATKFAAERKLTNSGIVHGAMRQAYEYALRYAQVDELLVRSSCDVIDSVPRD